MFTDGGESWGHLAIGGFLEKCTVSWKGLPYQIPTEVVRPGLRSWWVRVEERLDGTARARIGERSTELRRREPGLPELDLKPPVEVRKGHNRGGRSGWMKDFNLKQQPPDWAVAQAVPKAG